MIAEALVSDLRVREHLLKLDQLVGISVGLRDPLNPSQSVNPAKSTFFLNIHNKACYCSIDDLNDLLRLTKGLLEVLSDLAIIVE